jgi:hypothetical protein
MAIVDGDGYLHISILPSSRHIVLFIILSASPPKKERFPIRKLEFPGIMPNLGGDPGEGAEPRRGVHTLHDDWIHFQIT